MRKTYIAAAAIAATAIFGGTAVSAGTAGGPQYDFCPLRGCSSGLTVDAGPIKKALPKASKATACLNGKCRTFKVKGGAKALVKVKGLKAGKRAKVELTVRDAKGRQLYRGSVKAPVKELKPNGKDCPPTCYVVKAKFDKKKGKLVIAG